MSNELVASMVMDTKDFIAPINEAAKKVEEMASVSTDAMKKVSNAIEPATQAMSKQSEAVEAQSKSHKSSNETVTRSSHAMSTAFWISFRASTAFLNAVAGKLPGLRGLAVTMTGVSAAQRVFARDSAAATKANEREAAAIERLNRAKAAQASGGTAANATGGHSSTIPEKASSLASTASSAVSFSANALAGLVLYKSGLDEVASASAKHLSLNSDMMRSITGVGSTMASIASTGVDMLSEGIKGSLNAALQFTTGFGSITEAIDYGAGVMTSWAKSAQGGLDTVKNSARDAGLVFGTALAVFQSGGTIDAAAFYEEGQALNKMAEETERVAQKQLILKDALGVVNGAVTAAANTRQLALDQARVSQIKTIQGIDDEIAALKQKIISTDSSITKTKEWKKYTAELTAALEKQRTAIMAGEQSPKAVEDKSSPALQKFKQLEEELDKVTLGKEEAARKAIASMDATDEEVAILLANHDALVKLTEAQKAQEEQDKADKQGTDKLAKLREEYDLLTGAATKADIAQREAMRGGMSANIAAEIAQLTREMEQAADSKKANEQITSLSDELRILEGTATKGQIAMEKALAEGATQEEADAIGNLTDELEAAKQKDKTDSKKSGKTENDAEIAGSQDAAKLILRGVNGSGKLEDLSQKQLKELQDLNINLNKKPTQGGGGTGSDIPS